jgi:16S rRNA (guanine966-N2)-methyltransferase
VPRIIAGFAGSLQLKTPPRGTRPTADRVREALFSALEARGAIRGVHVLDLYAGSGALGLESVSRGAASAVLVDHNAAAVRVLQANVAAVRRAAGREHPTMTVVPRTVRGYLENPTGEPPGLVFLDPPYDLGVPALLGDLAALAGLVAPEAVVVLERSVRSAELDWPERFSVDRRRTYGDTAVTYAVAD